MNKLQTILEKSERYKGFTYLNQPEKFCELMRDKDIDVVQTHSTHIINDGNSAKIAGFCGVFTWKDNKLTPLDGDSYNKNMTVYGYRWWSNNETKSGLDVLVGNDW